MWIIFCFTNWCHSPKPCCLLEFSNILVMNCTYSAKIQCSVMSKSQQLSLFSQDTLENILWSCCESQMFVLKGMVGGPGPYVGMPWWNSTWGSVSTMLNLWRKSFPYGCPPAKKMLIDFWSLSAYCRERQQEVEKGFVVFPGSSFCSLQYPSAYREWETFRKNICEYPMSLHFQSRWQRPWQDPGFSNMNLLCQCLDRWFATVWSIFREFTLILNVAITVGSGLAVSCWVSEQCLFLLDEILS